MTDTLTEKEITAIQDLLIDKLEVTRDQVLAEAKIREELGADSIDEMDIVMSLEEEFGVTIPDDATEQVRTVEDIYTVVARALGR